MFFLLFSFITHHPDAISSHRAKVGGRLNYTANGKVTPYAVLAWEHEFSYKSRGSVYVWPERSGRFGKHRSGISGRVVFNPDANVQACMGQRDGVMGRYMANDRFWFYPLPECPAWYSGYVGFRSIMMSFLNSRRNSPGITLYWFRKWYLPMLGHFLFGIIHEWLDVKPVSGAEIKKPRKIGDFFTGKRKVIIPGAGSDSKIKTSLPFVARQSIR